MSEARVNRLLENVPTELRALRQWVIWRYVNRPDGTATKVPHCAGRPDRHASSTDELLSQADKAMYRVKETGKNRVQLAE